MAAALRRGGQVLAKLLALGPGYLIRTRTGAVQTTTVDGIEALEYYYGRYLPQVVNALATAGFVIAVLFTRNVAVALSTLAVVVFMLTIPRLWDAKRMPRLSSAARPPVRRVTRTWRVSAVDELLDPGERHPEHGRGVAQREPLVADEPAGGLTACLGGVVDQFVSGGLLRPGLRD
ncbi:MAG: hypothetical protein ACRDRK_05395 [Pseudonocardia sp.]